MILKLDQNGEVVESNSMMGGGHGYGRQAEYVMDHNLAELSATPGSEPVLQRRLIAISHFKKKIQEAKKVMLRNLRSQINEYVSDKKKELDFLKQSKKSYRSNLKGQLNHLEAVSKGYASPMKMSGVTGYGLTADGRLPDVTRAATDFDEIEYASEAFGNNMGAGDVITSDLKNTRKTPPMLVPVPVVVATGYVDARANPNGYTTLLKEKFVPVLQQDHNYEVFYPIAMVKTKDIKTMTDKDRYVMEAWNNDTFNAAYKDIYGITKSKLYESYAKKVFNKTNNTSIEDATLLKYAQQGWSWSVYFENNKYHFVKVRNLLGIPRVDGLYDYSKAAFPQIKFNYNVKTLFRRRWSLKPAKTNATVFELLSPVVKAAAKIYYAENPNAYDDYPESKSIFSSSSASVSGDFSHPMLKQGLLDIGMSGFQAYQARYVPPAPKPAPVPVPVVVAPVVVAPPVVVKPKFSSLSHPMIKQGLLR